MTMWQTVTSRIRWYHIVGLAVFVVIIAAAVWWWLERRKSEALTTQDETDLVTGS